MILTVNDDFKELGWALRTDEYDGLEKSIRSEGCRDAIVHWKGVIVDGHNRYEICTRHDIPFSTIERDFESVAHAKLWILENHGARRNLSPAQRDLCAIGMLEQLKVIGKQNQVLAGQFYGENHSKQEGFPILENPLEPINSAKEAAAEFQTTTASMYKTKKVMENAPEEIKQALLSGEMSRNEAYKKTKAIEKKAQQLQQRQSNTKVIDSSIMIGDMRVLSAEIPDDSIDLIFTDPPYGKEHVADYECLAMSAARILKPGASLLCYCGQSVLPDVLAVMIPHIRYHWTIALIHNGSNQRMPGKNVFIEWKPILWFTKGNRRDTNFISDIVKDSTQDKAHHEWGQGIQEALYYIEQLTLENELVLDPFCGGGTTLMAARKLNRQYLGFEIDESAAERASERLNDVK